MTRWSASLRSRFVIGGSQGRLPALRQGRRPKFQHKIELEGGGPNVVLGREVYIGRPLGDKGWDPWGEEDE